MQLWHSECILSFRVLDFPDLTVDGSFVTGAAVAATMIIFGYHPVFATAVAIVARFYCRLYYRTFTYKRKNQSTLIGNINDDCLVFNKLTNYGTDSENSVGRPNIPLLNEETILFKFHEFWGSLGIDDAINSFFSMLGVEYLPKTWGILFLMIIVTCYKIVVDWFLKTEIGLAIRATGDNKKMIRSFSANTDTFVILGLGFPMHLLLFQVR